MSTLVAAVMLGDSAGSCHLTSIIVVWPGGFAVFCCRTSGPLMAEAGSAAAGATGLIVIVPCDVDGHAKAVSGPFVQVRSVIPVTETVPCAAVVDGDDRKTVNNVPEPDVGPQLKGPATGGSRIT